MAKIERAGMVMHPVKNLDRALELYQGVLGLPIKSRDGDRFCALDGGGITIALGAGDEGNATLGRVAVAYRVDDVEAVAAMLEEAGAVLVHAPALGPSEMYATFCDLDGNVFSIYSPR